MAKSKASKEIEEAARELLTTTLFRKKWSTRWERGERGSTTLYPPGSKAPVEITLVDGVCRVSSTGGQILAEIGIDDPEFDRKIANIEDLVKDNAQRAFYYALWVLHGPFPAGEVTIAKNAEWAYEYAKSVLKGPFPAGEAAIAKSATWAKWYAYSVLRGPFPAGEAAIAKNARWAYNYALNVLKGPFPAGEAAIATDALYALNYARNVLKGPFPAGEAAIATDAKYAKLYREFVAKNMAKSKESGDEAAIAKEIDSLRSEVEELRRLVCNIMPPHITSSAERAYTYAFEVLKGPFPAGEAAIATDAEYACRYARNVLKGPFPAGEATIAEKNFYAEEYREFVAEYRSKHGRKQGV